MTLFALRPSAGLHDPVQERSGKTSLQRDGAFAAHLVAAVTAYAPVEADAGASPGDSDGPGRADCCALCAAGTFLMRDYGPHCTQAPQRVDRPEEGGDWHASAVVDVGPWLPDRVFHGWRQRVAEEFDVASVRGDESANDSTLQVGDVKGIKRHQPAQDHVERQRAWTGKEKPKMPGGA